MGNQMGQNNYKSQVELQSFIQHNEDEFIQLIMHRLGINTRPQNKELHRIIQQACHQFNCSPSEYLERLSTCDNNSPLLEFLVAGITVGETYFFRDSQQMNFLKNKLLPNLIQKKRNLNQLSLRIWSAGCASGEEIYTLAMMIKELIPDLSKWTLHLLGTDINTNALQKAAIGRYNKWSMRSISEYYQQRYFTKEDKQYVLSSSIKALVDFQYLNLNDNTYPSILNNTNSQDLIICRNVLIYFNQHSIKRLMEKISKCLVDGGYLMLGASDPVCIDGINLIFHHHDGMVFSREDKPIRARESPIKSMPRSLIKPVKKQQLVTDNVPLLLEKASKCADSGQLEQALKYCQDSIRLDATNKDSYFIEALTLIELNKQDRAEVALRKTLFLDRKFIEGHFQLGLLLLKTKKTKEGLKCLQNALELVNLHDPSRAVPQSQGLSYGRLAEIISVEIERYTKAGSLSNDQKK